MNVNVEMAQQPIFRLMEICNKFRCDITRPSDPTSKPVIFSRQNKFNLNLHFNPFFISF